MAKWVAGGGKNIGLRQAGPSVIGGVRSAADLRSGHGVWWPFSGCAKTCTWFTPVPLAAAMSMAQPHAVRPNPPTWLAGGPSMTPGSAVASE